MAGSPTRPLIYEVHTRHWLDRLGRTQLATVPDAELDRLAALGVTHVWLMGVWQTGPRGREVMRRAAVRARSGWTDDDIAGSPYAVAAFEVDPRLGGAAGLAVLRGRLAARGLAVILDFVPNHLGLDHDWLRSRPELFVGAAHPIPESIAIGDRQVAHGKDPHFPGWPDTVQLDYRRADTHQAMVEQLRAIADRCDGVRCDMAMLVLADVFAQTWRDVPVPDGAARATGEFWARAIADIKRAHPGFMFVAEAYWGRERQLCDLGFDHAYDKPLYDLVVHDRAWDVQPYLLGLAGQLARRVRFLENHDEPRAAAILDRELHRAAAALILGLPGVALVHDGQLDGLRRFAHIELARRADEPRDLELQRSYGSLLAAFGDSAVGRGDGRLVAPRAAWDDNPTARWFTIVEWQQPGLDDRFDLVVVNLAPHRAQCRVTLGTRGLAGRAWQLADRLGPERWIRDGAELAGAGLYLDLPARGAQLFACTARPGVI